MTRLHWERHGRHLDLCDGDELVATVETRRHGKAPTTYHWWLCGTTGAWGMTTTLDDARRAVLSYVVG
jgi:hypothetical protein